MKILLVDDENLIRQSLAALMHALKSGLDIYHASKPDEMREEIRSHGPFDLIVLDINLGGDDDGVGLDLLTELKERGVLSPVIMLSAQEDRATVLRSIELGAYGFLPKISGDAEMVVQAFQTVLSGQVYLPSTIHGKGGVQPPQLTRPIHPTPAELKLSPRLYETAYYIAQGLRGRDIAARMDITENVVAEYSRRVYQTLTDLWEEQVDGRADLMAKLHKKRIVLTLPSRD